MSGVILKANYPLLMYVSTCFRHRPFDDPPLLAKEQNGT